MVRYRTSVVAWSNAPGGRDAWYPRGGSAVYIRRAGCSMTRAELVVVAAVDAHLCPHPLVSAARPAMSSIRITDVSFDPQPAGQRSNPPSPRLERRREPIPIASSNPASQYTLLEKLGTGSFGTVYKAIHNDTKQIVAIKQIGMP
jgi:hypothetical protein